MTDRWSLVQEGARAFLRMFRNGECVAEAELSTLSLSLLNRQAACALHDRLCSHAPHGEDVIPTRRLVVLESPYAGDIEANVAYAREALADSLKRGEAPIASHLLFTQPGVLDDDNPAERQQGIDAGHAWYRNADACVVYIDRGTTAGMVVGIHRAEAYGIPIEYRSVEQYHRLKADAEARARGENLDGSPRRETVADVAAAARAYGAESLARYRS